MNEPVRQSYVSLQRANSPTLMKLAEGISRLLCSLFKTLFLFGLLSWLYVIAMQVTHPDYLPLQLAHIPIFPFTLRVDVTGILGFIISGVSFFLWQLIEGVRVKEHTGNT